MCDVNFTQFLISLSVCSQTGLRSFAMSVRSVFTLSSQKKILPEFYSLPFHTKVFSFTNNGKLLAVGAGSTDLVLL